MLKKQSHKDIFIIGFALFSMFFGAGNVIFPPYLGLGAGPKWLLGFICYYLADIGLALIALFSIFRKGGSEQLLRPIGKVASTILMCAIVLCIGPMLAIPRTAAMTFEMSVEPLTSSVGSVTFSLLFFVLIFLCSVRENSVVDIVGKFLTPMLLAGLVILIVKGILTPLGPLSAVPMDPNVAVNGIKAGYQTMDVLATVIFGVLMLQSAEDKGYHEHNEKRDIAVKSSLVAGVLLLAVYGGLTYLGATVSTQYDLSTGRTSLMLKIMSGLLGQKGTVLFAIVVALACVTTAVGLVSSCAEFFRNLSGRRLPYPLLVSAICVFSAVVSNVGLEQLVAIASPILDVVYPPTLVLIGLSFIPHLPNVAYKFGMAGALMFSLLTVISGYAGIPMPILNQLPLASLGFGWLLPAALFTLAGVLYGRARSKAAESRQMVE